MKISRFGYFWLDTWVMANIIQLATQDFCRRFLNHSNDPGGRQYDQMTQAARSAPANIAEGNSRHTTSRETEMKLTDVARATLAELTNDYFNWLLQHKQLPWSVHSLEYKQVVSIQLDKPTYDEDLQYQSAIAGKCDCIVTINIDDFMEFSSLPVYTPDNLLDLLDGVIE